MRIPNQGPMGSTFQGCFAFFSSSGMGVILHVGRPLGGLGASLLMAVLDLQPSGNMGYIGNISRSFQRSCSYSRMAVETE